MDSERKGVGSQVVGLDRGSVVYGAVWIENLEVTILYILTTSNA